MGYKRRGLTLRKLQQQGRNLAKEGGSVREYAVMIAEDNFSKSVIAAKRVLSDTNRNIILKKVQALSLEDRRKYNVFLHYAYVVFQEVPKMIAEKNKLNQCWTILLLDIQEFISAQRYAELLNSITPTLKEAAVYDKVKDSLLDMLGCWRKRVEFKTLEDGSLEVGGKILEDMKEDSQKMKMSLRRCYMYRETMQELLKDEEMADFISDYAIEYMDFLDTVDFVPEQKLGEAYLWGAQLELNLLRNNNAPEEQIRKQEAIVAEARKYAVIPDKESVFAGTSGQLIRSIAIGIHNNALGK